MVEVASYLGMHSQWSELLWNKQLVQLPTIKQQDGLAWLKLLAIKGKKKIDFSAYYAVKQ